MVPMKAIILPGDGSEGKDIPSHGWYSYVASKLKALGMEVIIKNMPDPDMARMKYWLPFIEENLKGDENSILIGHSTGAIAVMRYLEKNKALGAVLVGAYHTDLGDEKERKSGYFNSVWNWGKIAKNAKWIIQFNSVNDPFIPVEEARFVAKNLNSEYHELSQGHFSRSEGKINFPELVDAVRKKLI
jgi:uncharacterized protein